MVFCQATMHLIRVSFKLRQIAISMGNPLHMEASSSHLKQLLAKKAQAARMRSELAAMALYQGRSSFLNVSKFG
jgi:hypothetical protein